MLEMSVAIWISGDAKEFDYQSLRLIHWSTLFFVNSLSIQMRFQQMFNLFKVCDRS